MLIFLLFFIPFSFSEKTSFFRVSSLSQVEYVSKIPTYEKFISQARSEGAELILFPEVGLGGQKSDGEVIKVHSIPCYDKSNSSPKQYAMSCSAIENKIYVVLTIIEIDEENFYITSVVFDRKGIVITKYRKSHVEEPWITPGDSGPTFFETDFGETFGLFICYDNLWKHPGEILVKNYGITNFLYPQEWINWAPFDSLQVQQSFSEFFGVNLIGSNDGGWNSGGYKGQIGTGHFSKGEVLNYTKNARRNILLVSDFPFIEKPTVPVLPSIKTKWKKFVKQKWFLAEHRSTPTFFTIESEIFTCNFTYQVESKVKNPFWYSFYGWRSDFYGEDSPLFDSCGVTICPPGEHTPLFECFNGTDDFVSETFFQKFELTMTLKDNIRSVRTYLASDKYVVFYPLFKQFEIVHKTEVHSVKKLEYEKVNQPILSATITGFLDNDNTLG